MISSRVAFLGLLAATLWPPALAHADTERPGLAVTSFQLENGLRVLLNQDHTSPTVVVYLWYRVGSKDEKPDRTGFAHLFEHLMFKGSKHVPDGEYDKLLDTAGGYSNATTNEDRTTYYEELSSNYLALALYLEADRMAGLWDAMNQSVLDNQRDVVKNERRQTVDDAPYGQSELDIQQALWPEGHGYHNLVIGTMAHLTAASLAEVEAFYRTYYVPNNATLIIAGDLDVAATRALVERYFGWIPRQPDPPHVTLRGAVTQRDGEARLHETDRVQVSRVTLAYRSPTPYTADDAALRVAAQILAGGKSSRLHARLVMTDRLASYVNAYQYGQALGGTFEVSALAREGVDGQAVFGAMDQEIARLAATPPSEDELTRAKKMLEVTLLEGLEGLVARADQLAAYDFYTGDPNYLDRDLAQLEAVTADAVTAAVARWLRPDGRVVMVVSPRAGEKR